MAPSLSKTVSKALGSFGKKSTVGSGPTDKFILSNKYFLWVVLAFALLNLLYMAIGRDYMSIVAFVLVGFLTSFFSKNMVVILLVAIVVGNVVRFGARSLREGMSEGAEGEEEEKEKEGMEDEEEKEKEGMEDEEEKEKEGMDDEEEEPK
jgi:chromate transport protein ChrA